MSDIRDFFAGGGIFMYLLLLHLVVWLNLSWLYLVAVIVRAYRIGARARRYETACRARDAASALREADAKPGDGMGRVVAAAARSLISGAPPGQAAASARTEALRRLPGLHPLWAVSCFWLLVCCTLVTALLGALGQSFGLVHSFSALGLVSPEDKSEVLAQVLILVRYPVTFSIVIMALTGLPAVLAALLLAAAASSGRERRRALELASALTGAQAAPAPQSTGALAGAAIFLLLLLITSIVLVMPSGRVKKFFALLDQTWTEEPPKKPEKADDSKFAKIVYPPPEEPGAGAPAKKGKKPSEESTAAGSLPSQVIKKIMMSHMSQIKSCYESKLGKSDLIKSKIVVQFTISPKGSVSSAKITSSTLGSSGVEECVLKVVRRMKFPSPKGGGSVTLTYPFIFTGTY